MNIKLFTSLLGKSNASLMLRPSAPGFIKYFLIAATVNYSVVASGECEGELANDNPRLFDLSLDSVVPLLDRKCNFKITYNSGVLRFVEAEEKFYIEPLCVERISDFALNITQKYLDTLDKLERSESAFENLQKMKDRLNYLNSNYSELKRLDLSSWPSSDPWGDISEIDDTNIDKKYKPQIEELERKISELEKDNGLVKDVELRDLRKIAGVAAKFNTTVSMADNLAVVSLHGTYILQKIHCGVRVIPGKLLQRLIQEESGSFKEVDGELFYLSVVGTGKEKTTTMVFLQQYMPNTMVDGTLVTKGAVLEKYDINLKDTLQAVAPVLNRFGVMVLDMGTAKLVLSSEYGEHLVYKIDVGGADTPALRKALRGENVDVSMSCITIPREVQSILSSFKGALTVYIKERKIIIQSGTIYIIFAR